MIGFDKNYQQPIQAYLITGISLNLDQENCNCACAYWGKCLAFRTANPTKLVGFKFTFTLQKKDCNYVLRTM